MIVTHRQRRHVRNALMAYLEGIQKEMMFSSMNGDDKTAQIDKLTGECFDKIIDVFENPLLTRKKNFDTI